MFAKRFETVLHVNGYSLGEDPQYPVVLDRKGVIIPPEKRKFNDWEHVCWGSDGHPGRIPMTIALALVLKADLIIWSTGASRIPNGSFEADAMFSRAFDADLESLEKEFPRLHGIAELFSSGPGADGTYGEWLSGRSLFDKTSFNTSTSMVEAWRLIRRHVPSNSSCLFYTVSSDNHVERVIKEARKVFRDMPRVIPFATPTDTSYGRKGIDDIVIHELGESPKGGGGTTN